MSKESEPMLLFLHIPRTGGTSFNRAARLRYNPKTRLLTRDHRSVPEFVADIRSLAPKDLDRVRYFRGHFSYGVHDLLPKPARYITFLRDPVERFLSSYYFFVNRRGLSDVSLEDFVRKGIKAVSQAGMDSEGKLSNYHWTLSNNLQIRMLAGHEGRVAGGPISRDMLKVAKERITSDCFVMTGLTERFDESMLLLKDKLGWKGGYYITFNAWKTSERSRISDSVRDLIRSYNEVDLQLYAFAEELLDEEIEKQGPLFSQRLERFRSINRVYNKTLQPFGKSYAKVWRALRRS